jgi:hypothetical protein
MIVLQILLIPFVVLLLVSAIFMIGSTGLEYPGDLTQSDQPITRVDEADPTQIANTTLANIPILKI